jgi:hypothetical protein
MVTSIAPSFPRAILIASIAFVVSLPISALLGEFFIGTVAFVFCATFVGVFLSRIVVTDTGDAFEVVPRLLFVHLKPRVEARTGISIKARVFDTNDGSEPTLVEVVLNQEGRPFFTTLERFIFGSKRLAAGIRELVIL